MGLKTYNITIRSAMDQNREYDAIFTPIRKAGQYTLGWAEIPTEGLRFPAIRTGFALAKSQGGGEKILTVSDWQQSYAHIDLSSPEDIRELARTGSGQLTNPASSQDRGSNIWSHFM